MPETPLGRIPYPSGIDAPAAAADMMKLLMALDSHIVLFALDESDRDAKYSDAPRGALVTSGDSKKIWLKTGDAPGNWLPIYEDTGWITEGFTFASGFGEGSYLEARRVNTLVEVRADILRTGEDITANLHSNPGNVADAVLMTIPANLRPKAPTSIVTTIQTHVTSGCVSLTPSGNVALRDLHPGSTWAQGERGQFSFLFHIREES